TGGSKVPNSYQAIVLLHSTFERMTVMTTSDTTITPPNGNGAARSAEKLTERSKTSTNHLMDAAMSAGDELGTAAKTEFNNIMADLQELVSRAGKLSGQELTVIRQQISEKLNVAKD